jgi:hypothetical protein
MVPWAVELPLQILHVGQDMVIDEQLPPRVDLHLPQGEVLWKHQPLVHQNAVRLWKQGPVRRRFGVVSGSVDLVPAHIASNLICDSVSGP